MNRLDTIKNNLQEFTIECREDMHEPDEQEVSARVIGTVLDNAFGDSIRTHAIEQGYQEIVVILNKGMESMKINLADLIALARK